MRRAINKIKKKFGKPLNKTVALSIVFTLLFEMGAPNYALTLGGGPSQPEVDSFEPVGTSDMVDPFSGSFSYNIPLLNVDGYPINLAYQSGVTMDQEASWVGLGWNINAGAITRTVRGIPDDFNGDTIERDFNMKENDTYGLNTGLTEGGELFGLEILNAGITYSLGVKYNNYTGIGAEVGICPSLSVGKPSCGQLTVGYGLSSSSDEGVNITPYAGLSVGIKSGDNASTNLGIHIGQTFNSRQGLENMTIGASIGYSLHSDGSNISHSETEFAPTATFNKMMPTFTPQISLPLVNSSVTGSVKGGYEISGYSETVNFEAYQSSQYLATNSIYNPAFGYMHADAGVGNSSAMMDFNREKDGVFNQNTPDLPLTNFTYDIYSVSGQGMSGSYRPFRSDIGHVFDPYNVNTSNAQSVGMEVSVGDIIHAGVDWSNADVISYSGDWSAGNTAYGDLSFNSTGGGNPLYEPVYFKEANEKSVDSDPAFFSKVGGFDPQRLELNQISQFNTVATNTYESGLQVSGKNYRLNRDIRNESISMLTRDQLHNFGLQDTTGMNLYNGKGYHIGQVTSLGTGGKRYVYGIAAYNIKKEEVTFATGIDANADVGDHVDPNGGLVNYLSGDNSINNPKGIDNYYSDIKTPPYAHSYLLTAVLSADYVDADGIRGPSDGDLGTWTKFNYQKRPTYYNWRVPMGANKASYEEGLKSDSTDDKGNYIYGQKELWYLNSIETKNYIAVFNTQARLDGLGVTDGNGSIDPDTSHSQRVLNSISLYTKPNYNAHLANSSVALVPIEVVHFVYDYELCPNIPNNINAINNTGINTGKLTLKQVYFTYQNSFKGALSPYKFTYCYNNFPQYNFPYDIKAYNRWGTYKPNPGEGAALGTALCPAEYPYVEQNKTNEDQYVAAWTLTDITLPSGGSIHVDFESNQYSYVQNTPTTQMFKVVGAGTSNSVAIGSQYQAFPLTSGSGSSQSDQNYYLFFELQKDANNHYITDPAKYFNGLPYIYFRFLMQISVSPPYYEYVSGYAPPSSVGVCSDGAHGYVQLSGVQLDGNGSGFVSPIIKTALQFGRLYTPRVMWHEPQITDKAKLLDVLGALASAVFQITQVNKGLNGSLYDQGFCNNFVIDKSWIKLNSPGTGKLGGGARVKDIMMNDQWKAMTSVEPSFDYGQQYSYTLPDGVTSSGVASYEPQIGGDENALHTPVFYSSSALQVPDDQYYMETPFGESFFPSPSVGYSMVTVKNLQRANVHRNATGSVVHEFYTTKDFPTITKQTDLQPIPETTDPASLSSLFNVTSMSYMTASQGYSIELNDMNGKPKKQEVYQEGQTTPISSVQYFYQCTPYLGNNSFELSNNVTVVNPDGSLGKNNIGVFFDDVNDFRSEETDNTSAATMINLDVINIAGPPIPIPMVLPSNTSEYIRFRSCVNTKVIQRYGILDSTIVTDLGSTVKTQNLAYDAQTGNVLLTKTTNDFNDSIFNMAYPAYWYYSGMGAAYSNIGVSISNSTTTFTNGIAMIPNASSMFYPGDELALTGSTTGIVAWVTAVNGNNITAEYKSGIKVTGPFTNLEVIRSGRRNMQDMDMANITSLVNPINSLQSNSYQKITQASAREYTDSWSTYCNCFTQSGDNTDNPYVLGIRGNYRLKTSLLYLTTRDQSNFDNNTNIRSDGTFNSYNPFYSESGGSWQMTPNNWTYTSSVTNFNPYGQEIESVDALGRYSSATFGYNQTLPTAVAANSKYQEMGFDGFEDYGFDGCADNHMDVNRTGIVLDPTQAHTGRHSLLVTSGTPVTIGGQITTCTPVNPCNLTLCGMKTGNVDLSVLEIVPEGGTAPYTYKWTGANLYFNSDGYPAIKTNYSGSYTFTISVTDSKGCTAQATVTGNSTSFSGIPQCPPPCNLSLCYNAGPQQNQVFVLAASGGSGNYTFTIPSSVQSSTLTSNGEFVIDYSTLFRNLPLTITVTDANNSSCSYSTEITGVSRSNLTTTNQTIQSCCSLQLCYSVTPQSDGSTAITVSPVGGAATYSFTGIRTSGLASAVTFTNNGSSYTATYSPSYNGSFEVYASDENGCVGQATIIFDGGTVSASIPVCN